MSALGRRFGLARSTVNRALEALAHLGLLSREQGRGTFITRQAASRKIGLIVPGVAYSEFFPPVVDELSRLSQENDYVLLYAGVMAKNQESSVRQAMKFAQELVKQHVSGVIYQPFEFVSGVEDRNRMILDVFDAVGIPVILLGYDIAQPPKRSGYDVVGINNADAGYRLAEHLFEKGAEKIRFYLPKGMETAPAGYNRLRGVVTAVSNHSARIIPRGSILLDTGLGNVKALKDQLRRNCPDAIICCNDSVAAELRQMLGALDISVPRDVLLAGFDDVRIARLSYPPLTTIHQPCLEIARAAFDRLVARIANPEIPAIELLLPAPVVERASSVRTLSEGPRKRKDDR